MTITVKVHVNGKYRTTVKQTAGGLDIGSFEIGPDEEKVFTFHANVGDNVFIVSPDVHIDEKPYLDVQEESKQAAEAKAGIPSQRKEELALAAQTGDPVREEYKYDPATADKLNNLHDQEIAKSAGWSGDKEGVTTAESEKAQADIEVQSVEKKGAENAAKNASSTSDVSATDKSVQAVDDKSKASATAGTKSSADIKK